MLSSIAGLLLVPSYAYPLAALMLGLAAGQVWTRNWPACGSVVLASTSIGLLTMLLYSGVGAVSGWDRLLANRYVASRAAAQFWPGFRPHLYEVAAELFGPSMRWSGPVWLGLALLGGAVCWRLPPGPRRRAALLAWLLVALPIGLLAAQRVFPLARVLLYVPWAGAAWLLLVLPRQKSIRAMRPWAMPLAVGCLAGLGLLRLSLNEHQLRGAQRETIRIGQAYAWLRHAPNRRPSRVGMQAPIHELFFAHYLMLETHPNLRLASYRTPQPSGQFDFIVLTNAAAARGSRVTAPYRASYSDALVTIYTNTNPRLLPAQAR